MSDSRAGVRSSDAKRKQPDDYGGLPHVILLSQKQARLLRAGRFAELDIEHLADELEDVGKSEKRELANRMAKPPAAASAGCDDRAS